MKKIIFMGVGAVLLVGTSVGASLFFTGAFSPKSEMGDATMEPAAALPKEVFYYNVQPELVVNFTGNSRVKFLMMEMAIATHDEKVNAIIDDHVAELRNNMLMLLAEQDSESLKSGDGKTALREETKMVINSIVEKHYAPDKVVDVFFTRFVMQ